MIVVYNVVNFSFVLGNSLGSTVSFLIFFLNIFINICFGYKITKFFMTYLGII